MRFLDNYKIRYKLLFLILLPILGLLYFAQDESLRAYKQYKSTNYLEELVTLAELSSKFVHETQKERGMTAGYLGSKGKKFADKLPNQRKLSNSRFKELKNYYLTINFEHFPPNFKKGLDDAISRFENINSIRANVDTLKIQTAKAIGYYTKMNGVILDNIVEMANLSDDPLMVKEITAYSAFLLSKERAGIERAVGTNTLARDSFGPGMRVKFNNLIASQNAFMDTFLGYASDDAKEFYKKTVSGNAVDEVNKIRQTLLNNAIKVEIISSLKDIAGYGGFIHNFKNYVLRATPKYAQRVKKQYQEIMSLTKKYKALPNVTNEELGLLNDIEKTFSSYERQLSKVENSIRLNKNIEDIDRVVKVDDSTAIEALHKLGSSFFSVEPGYWFDQITQKINKLKAVDDYLSVQLREDLNIIKDKAYNAVIFYLSIAVIILLGVAVISHLISSRIINALAEFRVGLGYFFSYAVREKEYMKPVAVHGKDEFAQMTEDMNEGIVKTSHLIEQDKKVVKEIDDIMSKVGNGFFTYSIKQQAATDEVEQLRTNINSMLSNTKQKLDNINIFLEKYGKGEYSFRLDEKQRDGMYGDFGSLVAGINSLGDDISAFMAMFSNALDSLNSSTGTLTTNAKALSSSSNTQAASLEETAAAVEQITENIRSSSANIQNMENISNDLTKSANEGGELANKTATSMESISDEVSSIADAITVIDQIAFQTNILSLNAAVEAATAGEAGKGFAVVAGEVRNLAARSAEAAKEIKELVESANTKAAEGKKIADDMINGYSTLNEKISQTKQIIDHVTVASKEQESGIVQINGTINNLDKITQQNAAAASQVDDLATQISDLAENITTVMSSAVFDEAMKKQVCDAELQRDISNFKTDHITFKSKNFQRLDEFKSFTVVDTSSCRLGKWINEQEAQNQLFTKSSVWSELKKHHEAVHGGVQKYIDSNASGVSNDQLRVMASDIEKGTQGVFKQLNEVLAVNCKNEQIETKNTNEQKSKDIEIKVPPKKQEPKEEKTKPIVSKDDTKDEWESF